MIKIHVNKKIKTPVNIKSIKKNFTLKFKVFISKKIHSDFEKLSGDNSPIHSSITFCKKNGYKKKLGYGFLINCILSQIYGKFFPGGNELCLSQTGIFKSPYFIVDTLTIILKVDHKSVENQIVNISTVFYRQNKIKIFHGNGILKLSLNKS